MGDSQSVGPASPGGELQQLLEKSGFFVRTVAKGGRTAEYFTHGTGWVSLSSRLEAKPKWVIVFLGSNELANVAAFPKKDGTLNPKLAISQAKGHRKLKALIEAAGAKALFVGPPNFGERVTSETGGQPLNNAAPLLVPLLQEIYGDNFLDARLYTPEHQGVHFFKPKGSAKAFAKALLAPVRSRLL